MKTLHTSFRFPYKFQSLSTVILLAALFCFSAGAGYERGSRHSELRVKIPRIRTQPPNTMSGDDTNHQQYWISEIIKASGKNKENRSTTPDTAGSGTASMNLPSDYWKKEVQRIVEREQSKPLEMMLFDKYYWTHYLLEHRLEVE